MKKNMQKWISNITTLIVLLLASTSLAQSETVLLGQADSLYNRRKYAEAQQIYNQLFDRGFYTSATLLKMAFVHEGLGDTPKALFFLWLYYCQTEDSKAYDKIQVLTNAFNLKGYELSDMDRILIWINNRLLPVIYIFGAAEIVSLLFLFFSVRRKWSGLKIVFAALSILLIAFLGIVANYGQLNTRGVITKQTCMMTGPSAGSNLLTILDGGNQVPVLGSQDVWIKINWNDKVGYIKKNDLLTY